MRELVAKDTVRAHAKGLRGIAPGIGVHTVTAATGAGGIDGVGESVEVLAVEEEGVVLQQLEGVHGAHEVVGVIGVLKSGVGVAGVGLSVVDKHGLLLRVRGGS